MTQNYSHGWVEKGKGNANIYVLFAGAHMDNAFNEAAQLATEEGIKPLYIALIRNEDVAPRKGVYVELEPIQGETAQELAARKECEFNRKWASKTGFWNTP